MMTMMKSLKSYSAISSVKALEALQTLRMHQEQQEASDIGLIKRLNCLEIDLEGESMRIRRQFDNSATYGEI